MDNPDLPRRLGDLIREGRVIAVNGGKVRVRAGDVETGWIPWSTARAGKTRVWSPPSIDEQALLFCPEGDIERARTGPSFFSDLHPAPELDGSEFVEFEDGARISYQVDGAQLRMVLPGEGKITLVAAGGVRIEGDLEVTGDVVAGEETPISLRHHKTSGVEPGPGVSGDPV